MRDHSTKNQLKEKSPHAKIILSNTWPALLLYIFRKFSKFSVVSSSEFSHMSTVHLARCSQLLLPVRSTTRALGSFLASVAPWPACVGVFCGGRTTVAADRGQPCGITPFGAAQASWWLRVATSLPAHACSTVVMARHAQSAFSAADVPYDRSVGDRP